MSIIAQRLSFYDYQEELIEFGGNQMTPASYLPNLFFTLHAHLTMFFCLIVAVAQGQKVIFFISFQHQNGSVVDGLTLWKKNVDRRFEGVEECYICFFILHGSTYQMPKVGCPTCKKKFHSACLYKWFSTSQNSTCPLCRNLF